MLRVIFIKKNNVNNNIVRCLKSMDFKDIESVFKYIDRYNVSKKYTWMVDNIVDFEIIK